jgi:hypothetical protein
MKKKPDSYTDDDLRPEYDLRKLKVIARGPGRKKPEVITIEIAPDVAEYFPDSESVNEALRFLTRVAQGYAVAHRQTA